MQVFFKYLVKNYLAVSLLFYCCLAVILFKHYEFAIDPDGESYTNLAVKYASGDFKNAINGYWSPLVTWLIVPLILLGLNKVLAAKIIALSIGGVGIWALNKFIKNFVETDLAKLIILIPSSLLLFAFSNVEVGADVLAATSLLLYFSLLQDEKFNWSIKNALLIGTSGAICYFSKYYLFIFFIAHLFISVVIKHFYNKENSIIQKVKFLLLTYSIMLLIASPWLILINTKYNIGLIFCTSGKTNLTQALNGGWKILDEKINFFIFPHNSTADDFTEDLTFICGKYLGVFDSSWTRHNAILNLKKNCMVFGKHFFLISIFNWIILFFALVVLISKNTNRERKKHLIFYFSILPIYLFGYFLSYCEPRYFIIIFLLTIIIGTWLIEKYLLPTKISLYFKAFICTAFITSFFYFPSKKLNEYYDIMHTEHEISQKLKDEFHLKGIFFGEGGKYAETQYVCFETGLQNVIINPAHWNEREKIKDELIKNKIDYYFYWHWQPDQSDSLKEFCGFEEITKRKIYGLQIFKISH